MLGTRKILHTECLQQMVGTNFLQFYHILLSHSIFSKMGILLMIYAREMCHLSGNGLGYDIVVIACFCVNLEMLRRYLLVISVEIFLLVVLELIELKNKS